MPAATNTSDPRSGMALRPGARPSQRHGRSCEAGTKVISHADGHRACPHGGGGCHRRRHRLRGGAPFTSVDGAPIPGGLTARSSPLGPKPALEGARADGRRSPGRESRDFTLQAPSRHRPGPSCARTPPRIPRERHGIPDRARHPDRIAPVGWYVPRLMLYMPWNHEPAGAYRRCSVSPSSNGCASHRSPAWL